MTTNTEINISSNDNNVKETFEVVSFKKHGPAVFGYVWKDGHLVINENEAQIRKLMFEFFLKTKRKKTTATMLNNLGYRTRSGRLFSHTTVDRLLQDTTAKGMYKIEHNAIENYQSETNVQDNCKYIQCPSIIAEELWNSCQALIGKSAEGGKQRGPQTTYLLSGYLFCSCQKNMYVYHRNKYPAFRCRVCKTKISVDDIDTIYHEQLRPFLLVTYDGVIQKIDQIMVADSKSLYDEWSRFSFTIKRSIIEETVEKIIVFTNTIDINFYKKCIAHFPINVGKNEQVTFFSIVNKYNIMKSKDADVNKNM